MQDRVSLYPGRVTLTPVQGQENTFDMVRADQPTQEGTSLNKASLLKDQTAALYGLGNDAVPDDVFSVASEFKYSTLSRRVVMVYNTSGYFTGPVDALNNECVVVCVGGGGGGGRADDTAYNAKGGGGGSGFIEIKKITIVPGEKYDVVIGAGGESGTLAEGNHDGKNGGTTSFSDILSASGGGGGKASNGFYDGGNGNAGGGGGLSRNSDGASAKGGNGGAYGGGGGGGYINGTVFPGGTGGVYGGDGGGEGTVLLNGEPFDYPLAAFYPLEFSLAATQGLSGENVYGGSGGFGGNGGAGKSTFGGGGGGFGGNGGAADSGGGGGGGGGGFGGNGGAADSGGGGGGGFFSDQIENNGSGGNGGHKSQAAQSGSPGCVVIFYKKVSDPFEI